MRDRKGRQGAHSDLHNPAAGKAGPSSGRKDSRLSEAKIEKALPVKGPEKDLVEAITLGHDIGHTPFGHEGERVLDEILCGKSGYKELKYRTCLAR